MSDPTKAQQEVVTPAKVSIPLVQLLDEIEFEKQIMAIWSEVHKEITTIREEAYKTLVFMQGRPRDRFHKLVSFNPISENPDNSDVLSNDPNATIVDLGEAPKLEEFTSKSEVLARQYQHETENLGKVNPRNVLTTTTKAGTLLSKIEVILFNLKKIEVQPGTNLSTGEIVSKAMTIATIARDLTIASEGMVANIKEEIGTKERHKIVAMISSAVVVYLLFHPSLLLPFIPRIPSTVEPYWEILFWSLFGALCNSWINIAEDVMGPSFDPGHVEKYEYLILVAPFIALVLIFLISSAGLVSLNLNSTVQINFSNPNIPVLIVFAFLFGFFGKRTLEMLDNAAEKLFPSSQIGNNSGGSVPLSKQSTPATNR